MGSQWKFEVTSVGDPKIVDGRIEIALQVDAHGPSSTSGELRLMFDREAAGNLGARLNALLKLPQLRG